MKGIEVTLPTVCTGAVFKVIPGGKFPTKIFGEPDRTFGAGKCICGCITLFVGWNEVSKEDPKTSGAVWPGIIELGSTW